MDEVEKLYNEGKLLERAMDQPYMRINKQGRYYDCQSWVDEFEYLMADGLYSLSTTLVIPGVGVKNYKNMGFLINSDLAECFHIAKTDSGSCVSIRLGDCCANKPDFDTLAELATFIRETKETTMNEVNVNVKLDGIVGLFINKCTISRTLLKKIYIVRELLKSITGIEYPIYLYDWTLGKFEKIEITNELAEELVNGLDCQTIMCWPDRLDKPEYISLSPKGLTK